MSKQSLCTLYYIIRLFCEKQPYLYTLLCDYVSFLRQKTTAKTDFSVSLCRRYSFFMNL